MYWSRYDATYLARLGTLLRQIAESVDVWCVFDNTASGAALENARELQQLLRGANAFGARHGEYDRSDQSPRRSRFDCAHQTRQTLPMSVLLPSAFALHFPRRGWDGKTKSGKARAH
jgi:hypothetical protein